MGTLNYLEAARQDDVRRFVYASSGAPVFFGEPPVDESMAPKPASPYGASKLSGEAYCSAYFHSFGVETVALRFGNVYGPGSGHKSSVVATFIRNALAGEMLEIHGDGRQTRDFIHVEDLLRAIKLAATVPAIGGEVFQIATNVETTIAGILNKMLQILATYGIRETQLRHVAARPGDVRRNFSDTAKARELLGWQAEVKLSDGLKETMDWFLSRHRAKQPAASAPPAPHFRTADAAQ